MNELLPNSSYRRDIDGLRAIAILAVIGFHAAPGRIPGGFIGVDIFFVISGFLISTIIFKSLETDNFNFLEFYSRRIKRIFPALLIVLFASFLMGWFVLLADEYKQLGKHIAGGAGFVSNLILWGESGYFDNLADTKPLLHLWSLGIEEQFYIVWPILLWFVWKWRINLILTTLLIIFISFLLNINATSKDTVAAFYSPQTRFWELLVGALLAFVTLYKKVSFTYTDRTNDSLSFIGATLVVSGIYIINKNSFFPGWLAILPVVGTAAIILAGSKAWINRVVLSNRVLVWIGLISFPLYLWHWPLLSFLRIIKSGEAPQIERIYAIVVAVLLAWLTYKFIEAPIRFGNHEKLKTKVLFGLMIVFGFVGYATYLQDGFKSRASLPQTVNQGDIGHYQFFDYQSKKYSLCTPVDIEKEAGLWDGFATCYQSKKNRPIQIALIGDSHAQHLFPGLSDELAETNVVIYSKGGLPLLNNNEFNKIFKYLIDDPNIDTVIMAANWGDKIKIDSVANVESNLVMTVAALIAAKKTVYLVDDVPKFLFEPNRCKYVGRLLQENGCTQNISLFNQQSQPFWSIQKSIAEKIKNVKIIRTGDYFCDKEFCSMAKDGLLFYRDNNHLNVSGSQFLWRNVLQSNPDIRKITNILN